MPEFEEQRKRRNRFFSSDVWDEEEVETGRGLALLSYLPGFCFVGLLQSHENRFVYHHAKQGFLLLILEVAALLFRWNVLWDALLLICAGMALMGMINAFSGRSFRIPFLSDWFGGLRG